MINKLYERLWMLVNVLVFKIYKFLNKVFKNNMYNIDFSLMIRIRLLDDDWNL